MQKTLKTVAILGVTVLLAACAGRTEDSQDVVFVPVEPEPAPTGKF